MTRTNSIPRCGTALIATLITTALGTVAMGCLPTGNADLARYNTTSYSPNTNSTGFAGTWLITVNDEFDTPPFNEGANGFYQRTLVRIKPVGAASDSYEFTYCGNALTRSTVAAAGNTIALPSIIDGQLSDYSVTANGRMMSNTTLSGSPITLRAVRLSGNPDVAAGTVGFEVATTGTGVLKQPTACFSEGQIVTFPTIGNSYALYAIGESSSSGGNIVAQLTESYVQGNSLSVSDGVNSIAGEALSTNRTLTSDAKGLRGKVETSGDDGPNPAAAGSLVMDVKL